MSGRSTRLATVLLAFVILCFAVEKPGAQTCLRGVNLAGAEFGSAPGEYGKDYIYPSDDTLEYFAAKGMNVIRLPFKWERLQPQLNGPLAAEELARLLDTTDRATQKGLAVILDPHNYAGYGDDRIGEGPVDAKAFADFWSRLSAPFAGRDDVIFLLMNEPVGITAKTWLEAANAAIAGIRQAGAENLIMVPGTIWTGASHWFDDQDGGSNAELLQKIHDPLKRFAFDLHQYMDKDYSGTHATCPRVQDAIQALEGVSGWLRQHGFSGFLGEFGGTKSPDCLTGLAEFAEYINGQGDIWLGWTVWAGGEWWGDYPLSLQPANGEDREQLSALMPMIASGGHQPPICASVRQPVRDK